MRNEKINIIRTMVLIVVLIGLIALSGCDKAYGVRRQAKVSKMPNVGIIENIIKSTKGVYNVKYEYFEGGKTLSIKGLQPGEKIHSFNYSGKQGVWGSVQFIIDPKNNIYFTQTLLDVKKVPENIIKESRPVMLEIESKLEKEGGIEGLTSNITEYISR